MSEYVKIKVFDAEYNLRLNSGHGPERLERVAAYVDSRMREIAAAHLNLSAKDVAVLAALNIAEECLEARGGTDGAELAGRVTSLKRRVERALGREPAG